MSQNLWIIKFARVRLAYSIIKIVNPTGEGKFLHSHLSETDKCLGAESLKIGFEIHQVIGRYKHWSRAHRVSLSNMNNVVAFAFCLYEKHTNCRRLRASIQHHLRCHLMTAKLLSNFMLTQNSIWCLIKYWIMLRRWHNRGNEGMLKIEIDSQPFSLRIRMLIELSPLSIGTKEEHRRWGGERKKIEKRGKLQN